MKVTVRSDSVEVEGYVNAIERKSKTLMSRLGEFVERICKGAFSRAIERNNNIRLLLDHDWNRDLAGTDDGSLELSEDNIGLKAHAIIRDAEAIEKARNGEFVGWSFGFFDRDVEKSTENGITVRDVKELDLYEVSILDRNMVPAYDGTLVTVRADTEPQYHGEAMIPDSVEVIEIRAEEKPEEPEQQPKEVEKINIDYSGYEKMIKEMREGYKE